MLLGRYDFVPIDSWALKVVSHIVTGIVSALKNIPVRHDVAMTGEITIMGKVLAVGGIQAKLLAAIEAGVKTVILPAENEQDVRYLPDS